MKTKLLLDTDIGTDSDDAVCLAYLLHQPACELLGITTVGYDSRDRAMIADALCTHFGRTDIPIAAGADTPLFPNYYWAHHQVNQLPIVERWPAHRSYHNYEALDLMRQVIEAHPGEVILLTIGMLTNAALLTRAYPDTAAKLKGIVLMGGRFQYDAQHPRTECNVMLDPVAAGAVFHFPFSELKAVGAGATNDPLHLTSEEVDLHFGTSQLEPVRECCRCWIGRKPGKRQGLIDPFTAATLFEPALCEYVRGRIGVKLYDYDLDRGFKFSGDKVTGATPFSADPAGPHQVAFNGMAHPFVAHLLATLCD